MKKIFAVMILSLSIVLLAGCEKTDTQKDISNTLEIGDKLVVAQPTPTDIDYSLERYNLVKRAYWVNGQREKALTYPCAVDKPLGYVVLFTDNGAVVGSFIVDGKITSLNSFLTPNSWPTNLSGASGKYDIELPDIDGSYGENDGGIFFFTPDGKYIEWTGAYLYSDIPFEIDDPILKVGG